MSRVAPIHDVPPIDHIKEGVIFALWRSGFDTKDIAQKCSVTEFQVYNLLLRLKEGKHEHRSRR